MEVISKESVGGTSLQIRCCRWSLKNEQEEYFVQEMIDGKDCKRRECLAFLRKCRNGRRRVRKKGRTGEGKALRAVLDIQQMMVVFANIFIIHPEGC